MLFSKLVQRVFVLSILLSSGCTGVSQNYISKINGVNLVSPPKPVLQNSVATVKQINANWVSIIPYAFIKNNDPKVYFDTNFQWWGEKIQGTEQLIKFAQNENLKIMLKPHIWVQSDGWAGDFSLTTSIDWKIFEESYTNYILAFAKVAQKNKIPLLCIGTEMRNVVKNRSGFWKDLIQKIKKNYSGKLTYSANWDNYENVTFWNQLDYIGIDAYFPLNKDKTPAINNLKNHWQPIKSKLEYFSKTFKKPILFTEYGYKSCDYTAAGHWNTDGSEIFNGEAQYNSYKALYETFWNEDWFAGGFLWKWFLNTERIQPENTRFTPQKKPVLKIISEYYK